ncbi:MAG: endonuclease MutS2 [Myxococcota bacterium]
MTFRCDEATLERLEWPRLTDQLSRLAATERGARACRDAGFGPTRAGAADRRAETSEARVLLAEGEEPPFGGITDLGPILESLGQGAVLAAEAVESVRRTLEAARRLSSFLAQRSTRAPRLATLAETLPDLRGLEAEIARRVSPEGALRDDASPTLARAIQRARRARAEVQRRMQACLQDPQIVPFLQDSYVTSRWNRPVLPIRTEARGRVRGLVHDVSSSGTTVFIEPESVVETGNRLRLAEGEQERESERILRALSDRAREDSVALEATGATLERLDVILARGRLSLRLEACDPEISPDAPLCLRQLRHPLLLLEGDRAPESVIPNDVVLPREARGLVLSGPNAGGKTALAKAIGLAVLSARAGLHVACSPGSSLPELDSLAADIGDEQDLRSGLSTFSARMTHLAEILREADAGSLVILDEVGGGTEPGEGAALAQAALETLVERGSRVIATTHFNRLKELAGTDARFVNASAEFDRASLDPTYRVRLGVPGSSGATWLAERVGLDPSVVERARALLDRDDRRLEALTRSLSELRQEVEAERAVASLARRETEAKRDELERRLATLRAAREKAVHAMQSDLESAYRSAREEIAAVVRDLQRAHRSPGPEAGRAANRARDRLERVVESAEQQRPSGAVEHGPGEGEPVVTHSIDWTLAQPGARVSVAGLSGEAVLVSGPDRRGRVEIRLGSARMTVARDRLQKLAAAPRDRSAPHPRVEVERRPADEVWSGECDLRGLRVDEALDRAEAHLNARLGTGAGPIQLIHGHGTGALRNAVREWLRQRPDVASYRPGDPAHGGNGVTVVTLTH